MKRLAWCLLAVSTLLAAEQICRVRSNPTKHHSQATLLRWKQWGLAHPDWRPQAINFQYVCDTLTPEPQSLETKLDLLAEVTPPEVFADTQPLRTFVLPVPPPDTPRDYSLPWIIGPGVVVQTVATTPEPDSWLLACTGAVFLALLSKRAAL